MSRYRKLAGKLAAYRTRRILGMYHPLRDYEIVKSTYILRRILSYAITGSVKLNVCAIDFYSSYRNTERPQSPRC